jgi:hypothetical protein
MLFNRIFDNKLHVVGEVDNLGFDYLDKLKIPDEYLESEEFVICLNNQNLNYLLHLQRVTYYQKFY